MSFKSNFISAVRSLGAGFLPPFLFLSGMAFLIMRIVSARSEFFSSGSYLITSALCFCGSFICWYFFGSAHSAKRHIYTITDGLIPLFLVGIIVAVLSQSEVYHDHAAFISSIFITLCVIRFGGTSEAPNELKLPVRFAIGPHIYRFAVFATIMLGVFLCTYEAYTTPTISVDEAHSSISASGILHRGFPYFPNTEVIYSRSWVDLYSIALSYKLFGFSAFSARIPSLIAYTLTIILFFFTVRLLVPRIAALTALLLFAINPWILHYGSYARMYIFLLLFSTLFSYFTIRYLRKKEWPVLWIGLPLTILLGIFSERTFLIFGPPYALLVLWSLPRTRLFWKRISLYAILPGTIATLAAVYFYFVPISAFITRYVIGFNNGQNPLAYAQVQFVPVEWLAYYGFPTVLLVLSSVLIVLRGSRSARVLLAVFWFGELLVDVLIYSNFPSRRFNYSFIVASVYALVITYGLALFFTYARRWQGYLLAAFVLLFGVYQALFAFDFPAYADFSREKEAPPGSVILGYPTSPMVFYNIQLDLHNVVHPFITDEVEMSKYIQDGRDIYSGGEYVTGVSGLNALRKNQDVYIFYEKTRLDFVNRRTADYIFTNCQPLDDTTAAVVPDLIKKKYQPDGIDYDTRNTMLALKCPKLTP